MSNGKTGQISNAFFTAKSQGTGLELAIANARCSHLGHSKRRTLGNVLLYTPQYSRSDWVSFHAAGESYFAPDECMSDPIE